MQVEQLTRRLEMRRYEEFYSMRSFPSIVWHAGILNIAYVDYTQTYNRILYPSRIESRGRNSRRKRLHAPVFRRLRFNILLR